MTSICGVLFVQSVIVLIKLAYLQNYLITSCGLLGMICFGMVLLVVITLNSSVHENSSDFFTHIHSTSVGGKLGRRLIHALKVVSVKSGNFYEIRRNTCLTALGIMTNTSASMLLYINI